MSAAGPGNNLGPLLLRSTTPAPNEKVLDYLEGMSRDEVDIKPPRSLMDHTEYRSNASHSRAPSRVQSAGGRSRRTNNSRASHNGGGGEHDEDDGNDFDSTAQERSQNGDAEEMLHVPGPQDPPGPRYESYDSGPSFGNMGPMPDDSAFDPQWGNHKASNAQWEGPGNPEDAGGKAGSPKHSSFHFGIETPSSKGSRNQFSPSPSSQSPSKGQVNSPKASSKAPTADAYRPLSPQSNQSRKTRTTERAYRQPLPESNIDMPLSPVSPARSTAPSRAGKAASAFSVSPSDSLSQYHVKKARSKTNGTNTHEEMSAPRSEVRSVTQNGKTPSHQSRPFSPYRHAPTTDDLLHAVVRDRAVPSPIQEQPSKEFSKAPSSVHASERGGQPVLSAAKSKASSPSKAAKAPSAVSTQRTARQIDDADATPTPTRPGTPGATERQDGEDEELVQQMLASAGQSPRTSKSYAGSVLGSDIVNSHFHDNDLCVLFHFLNDERSPEQVKKVLRKAIRRRVKDLGMKYDNDSIRDLQKSHAHGEFADSEEPPKWASDLKRELVLMQQRIESLGPKIENLRPNANYGQEGDRFIDVDEDDDYTHTPVTQTINIHTQPTGTLAESAFQPESEVILDEEEDEERGNLPEQAFEQVTETGPAQRFPHLAGDISQEYDRDDSPGQQYLEEELYKLRQKPGSQTGPWEVAHDGEQEGYDDEENQRAIAPTIPGSEAGYDHENAPAAPPSNHSMITTQQPGYGEESNAKDGLLPWQKIHQRLLSWAIIWPMSEFDEALASTMRGRQVNEVAMSIWSTQTYKRYVRSRLTDNPKQAVDRLFVPPNMADAINNAVFNGRHGDACGMLRELWAPFGLPGMPRLLVVLAKHRSDENHWVVHRFSLPEGLLTTYDSYPEKTLPDGRPLGWWFAIRVAWPTALYPNPDHLIQKMVRLHRPMQRSVDNSLAAGGIWRNVLMGSRPERSLDLERLRDLINTEVKNLRQRKQVGKLSISAPQPTWEDMNMN